LQFCWDVNADLVGLVAVMRLHLSLLLLWLLPQSSHGCRELHGGLAVHSFPPCHNQLHLGILPTCRGKSLAECVQGLLVGVTQQGLTVDAKQVVILAEPAILQ